MNDQQDLSRKLEQMMERMEEREKRQEEREAMMMEKLRKQEEILSQMQKRLDSIEVKTRDSAGTTTSERQKLEGIDADVKEEKKDMREKIKREDRDGKKKIKEDQKEIEDGRMWESSIQGCKHYKFNKQVHSHLTGDLMVLRKRILIGESQICVGKDGDFFSFEEFRKLVGSIQMKNPREHQNALANLHNPLWIITPEKYEVECCGSSCKKMLPLSTTIRDDCLTVNCPHCDNWTLLGNPFPGFKWIKLFPCGHFIQIKNDCHGPENCSVCKEYAVRIGENLDEFCRTPRRIYNHSK